MTLTYNPHDGLTVNLIGMERIWAVRGDLKVESAHIKSAWLGMPKTTWRELRVPGSFVPGLIKAGTYFTNRGKEFWYVTRTKCNVVTIELDGFKKYDRLVLGFESPTAITGSGLRIGMPPSGFEIVQNT